jgi:hypothetical protein
MIKTNVCFDVTDFQVPTSSKRMGNKKRSARHSIMSNTPFGDLYVKSLLYMLVVLVV